MFADKELGFVIQARLGSHRLPGKALLYYSGSTVIGYLINSLIENGIKKESICVATSRSHIDNVLANYINGIGIKVVRGDEKNVLSRYQKTAYDTGFKNIVRLTGDNPLIEPSLIHYCINEHLKADVALTTTRKIENRTVTRYVPKGLSVDVINSEALLSIDASKCDEYEKEHVIPFFFKNLNVKFIKDYVIKSEDMSIDTIEDYVRLFQA